MRGLVRQCLIVALLLAVWAGRADATCGDYLHVGGMKMSESGADADQPAAPKPCHGPGCRQGNRHGPLAPSVPIELSRITDHLLKSGIDHSLHRDASERLSIDVPVSGLEGHLPGVNRPPERI